MKLILGCLLAICILTIGIFVFGKNDTPVEVTSKYFELSRIQKFEEASNLWSKDKIIKSDNSEISVKSNAKEFRFDISYSKEIFEYQYEILDFREFSKSDDSTVLCLSIKNQNQRKTIFRVELSQYGGSWKINNMKDASEDALAVIHNDCSTINF